MGSELSGRCAIVGVGETPVGKLVGRTTMSVHLEAIQHALNDAGLTRADIDGFIAMQPGNDAHRSFASRLAHAAGITPHYMADTGLGGAGPNAMAQQAVLAIAAGLCETVLCVHGAMNATGHQLPSRGRMREGREDYEDIYGLFGAPVQYATIAARHMHEYGTTAEQMAAVAVACRKHASLNPAASMREPITVEDVLQSRWIAKPLHILDCCLVSDGAVAFIVTSRERARDLRKLPVYIAGFGQHHPHFCMSDAAQLTTLGSKRSAEDAFRMAGLKPSDMDFAEIYDCFTIIVIITLEDYGFCAKGEGGAFVQGGRIEIGGALPVNTHGGLLSHGHVEGMNHIVEATRQLRGGEVEPERQVSNHRAAVVSGNGGTGSSHATLVLTRD